MRPWIRLLAVTLAGGLLLPAITAAHAGHDERMAALDERIQAHPGDPLLFLGRGALWGHEGEWEAALTDFDAAAALGADPALVDLARGELYLDARRPAAALPCLDRALEADPGSIKARHLRGRAFAALGMVSAAADDLGAVLATDAHPSPDLLREVTQAFDRAGRDPRALETLLRRPPMAESELQPGTAMDAGRDVATGTVTAAQLVRGPYLQLGTATGIVVRWRTDVATDSRVRYGPAPQALDSLVDDPVPTTEHLVALSGLAPETTYFYSVGSSAGSLAGGDADHTFASSPPPAATRPTRIWVVGDSGTADANARAVRDAYESFAAGRRADLWLMLGDNAYVAGTDAEYQAAVFDMYPRELRTTVLWPTLGNHDGTNADSATQTGPYYDIFTLPRAAEAGGVASGTEAYYSFDYGNLHFVSLDSFESDRSPTGPMLTWLAADLAANHRDWVIAYWHHPPYSKGSHDSDADGWMTDMRENALPILESLGVDLVLTGHSHAYERSYLLDGHYGTSDTLVASMVLDGGDGRPEGDGAYGKPSPGPAPHEGAVYSVVGCSGQVSGGTLDHPAMFISLSQLGSLVLDVDRATLTARFLGTSGAVLDSYTVIKGGTAAAAIFADGFESGGLSGWSVAVP